LALAITQEDPDTFVIGSERFGTTVVLRLAGELDLASGDRVGVALREHADAESVVLDLERLEFIDSAGLRAIYELWQVSRNDGFSLAIVRAAGQVRRLMDLTGLDEILPLADEPAPEP
jgi:anti-anti-sigma factor